MKRDPLLWAALAYSLGLVSALIVLAVEKKDPYVRFHAVQSLLAVLVIAVVSLLLPTVPVIGSWSGVHLVFRLGVVVLWIFLMFKAVQGEAYRLPYLGDVAAGYSDPGK